jgi:hypothetical protein
MKSKFSSLVLCFLENQSCSLFRQIFSKRRWCPLSPVSFFKISSKALIVGVDDE